MRKSSCGRCGEAGCSETKDFAIASQDWLEENGVTKLQKLRREQCDAEHGERQAERMIQEAVGCRKTSEAELRGARKGDWRKRVIGHYVRRDTSVTLRWLAKRLRMGSEGHVSRITSLLANVPDHPARRVLEKTLQRNARKNG